MAAARKRKHNLVIVESPAKVKTIKKFLGSNYEVAASYGHVRDLPKSRMGIDVDNGYEPKYITIRGKGELLADLRKKARKADRIYLLDVPRRTYRYRILRRFLRRKLGMENGKKETLHSLFALLKWADKYQEVNLPEILRILAPYADKVTVQGTVPCMEKERSSWKKKTSSNWPSR